MLTGDTQLRKQNTLLCPPFDICIKAAEMFGTKLNLFQKGVYAVRKYMPLPEGFHLY